MSLVTVRGLVVAVKNLLRGIVRSKSMLILGGSSSFDRNRISFELVCLLNASFVLGSVTRGDLSYYQQLNSKICCC